MNVSLAFHFRRLETPDRRDPLKLARPLSSLEFFPASRSTPFIVHDFMKGFSRRES